MTDELCALNARFIHNFITNDVGSHDAILHPDFICITPTGARVSRADYLEAWATGFDAGRIPYYDYRDEKIDVFGDTALVRSTNKRVGSKDGVETVGMTPGGVVGGGQRTAETKLTERFEVAPDGQSMTITYSWEDAKIFQKPHVYKYSFDRLPPGSYAFEDWCDASDPIEKYSVTPPIQK